MKNCLSYCLGSLTSIRNLLGETAQQLHRDDQIYHHSRAWNFRSMLGWLRQEENMYVKIPDDIRNRFSKRVHELMGYKMQGRKLGWFG